MFENEDGSPDAAFDDEYGAPIAGTGNEEGPPSATTGKVTGCVKWFDPKKGFGFIQPDDGAGDIFVHQVRLTNGRWFVPEGLFSQTSIQCNGYRALRNGELVEFEMSFDEEGRKRAIQVTGPDGAQPLVMGHLGSANVVPGMLYVQLTDHVYVCLCVMVWALLVCFD